MATIQDVQQLAIKLLSQPFTFTANGETHEISAIDLGYYFEFDKGKKAFGTCHFRKKKITLSLALCEANLDKLFTQITDTTLHEIAHAFCVHVYGTTHGRGHDWRWISIAKQIGCNGERCYSFDNVNPPKSKYTLVCNTCGRETPKHKKVTRKTACAICCKQHNFGRFSYDYLLELRVNN